MKKLLAPFTALMIGLATGSTYLVAFHVGEVSAQPAAIDAGVPDASSLGSAISTVPAATPVVVDDPIKNPTAYLSELATAKKNGWPLAILFGVFGLCEVLAAAGSKVTVLAWLGKGRISILIGGLAALSLSSINALANGGTWLSVGVAAIGAISLYLHPAGTDPAKS